MVEESSVSLAVKEEQRDELRLAEGQWDRDILNKVNEEWYRVKVQQLEHEVF